MKQKKITSVPGIFGGTNYYDENGRQNGNNVGYSVPGLFDNAVHYDEKGERTGESIPALPFERHRLDNNGDLAGVSSPILPIGNIFDGNESDVFDIGPGSDR